MEAAGKLQQLGSPEPIKIPSSLILSRLDHPGPSIYADESYLNLKQLDSTATVSSDIGFRSSNCSYSSQQATEANGFQPSPIYLSMPVGSTLEDIPAPYLLNSHRVTGDPIQSPPQRQNVTFQEDQSSSRQQRVASSNSRSSASNGSIASNRKRIRWTKDLHEQFLACTDSLGGPQKATPKGILKLMESTGLTIFHVKSHLQKFRSDKFMSQHKKASLEEVSTSGVIPQLYKRNSMLIGEAIKLQLDVQKHLNEQLQIQRDLRVRIEESGRQLKMMLEQQQRTNKNVSGSVLAK